MGGWLVRGNVRLNRPEIVAGAHRNLIKLCPGITEANLDAHVAAFLDNVGRMMSEFAVLQRIGREGRVTPIGLRPVMDSLGQFPVLAICLHTGNWEVFGPALKAAGLPTATFYEPPVGRVERKIAESIRRSLGFELLEPNRKGLRRAIDLLGNRQIVAIFGDEARHGQIMAPLFGRPAHTQGNLAIAARLARKTGARIVTVHCERYEACRFKMIVSDLFQLPPQQRGILEDVAFLNGRIEPLVLANLHQWYYLDDSLEPVDKPESLPSSVAVDR